MNSSAKYGHRLLCASTCILCWLAVGLAFSAVQSEDARLVWGLALLRSLAQAAAALGCAKALGLSPAGCGLRRPEKGGLLPAFCCGAAAVGFALLFQTQSTALPEENGALLLAFLQLCVAAPLAEELVFRGAILGALEPFGTAGILLQAVIFAALHGSALQRLYALVLGLLLGWLARRTKSVWPGAVVHCLNNGIVFAILWSR